MKRFISTVCLLVGASVASFAGSITSANGTNLLGPSASLQTFDDPAAFPLNAYTSLPNFTLGNGVTVGISGSTTGTGTNNTGNRFAVRSSATDISNFGPTLAGGYLQTFANGAGGSLNAVNFVQSLTFTFSAGTTEFLIDYFGADASSNYFTVNGLATQYALPTNICNPGVNCVGTGKQIGFVADGGISQINTITFTFVGTDNLAGNAGDSILFDNLRVVGAGNGGGDNGGGDNGGGDNGGGDNGGGGEVIPEPSTYALMGAGLMALAYARRKK